MATGHVGGDNGNPTREEVTAWKNKLAETCKGLYAEGKLKAWIIGVEQGDEGRWHCQCYFRFKDRFGALWPKNHIYRASEPSEDESLRFGACDGTAAHNYTYCSKGGDFEHEGEFDTEQGKRNDLESLQAEAKANCTDPDALLGLYENHFGSMVRYGRGIEKYIQLCLERERRERGYKPPEVYAFIGATGTGKSRRAYHEAKERFGDKHIFIKSFGGWYDGYRGHKAVIINEFTGAGTPLSEFQQITDGYPYRVPVKNSHYIWMPDVIYLTSNVHPDEWWSEARLQHKNREIWPSIRRRIKVTVFRGEWTPETASAFTEEEPVPSGSGGNEVRVSTTSSVARVIVPDSPEPIPVVDHENCPHNQQGAEWYENIRAEDLFSDTTIISDSEIEEEEMDI